MKLIENMTIDELEREHRLQQTVYTRCEQKIAAIHGRNDYSDEVAKAFHLGMVGFRRDRRRVNQTLERAISNGVAACELYERRDNAGARLAAVEDAIKTIQGAASGEMGLTVAQIRANNRQRALNAAPQLKWVRKGNGYASGGAYVQKIDTDFVIVEINGKRIAHWYKTVKEAKAVAAILLGKGHVT